MERIKEALDRAKQLREAAGNQAPAGSREGDDPSRAVDGAVPSSLQIDYTSTRIITPDPVVTRNKRVIAPGSGDPAADAYRMLRTRTLRTMQENGWNSLAITSPSPGEGKSLTSVNLGLSMAREIDRTVLLVDLDLRRPSIHDFFGFEVEHGISEYLTSDIPVEQILINPAVERFVVLPGRGRVENSSELLSSPKMRALAAELANRYSDRIVIYDLPPVLSVDDALAFAPLVDAFLLVVAEGGPQAEEVIAAHDILSEVNILGTVLNKASESNGHYYY